MGQKSDGFPTDLIHAVRETFEANAAKETDAAPTLERILAVLPKLQMDPDLREASKKPVCRYLAQALDLGKAGPAAPVARVLQRMETTLHWRQNPRYSIANRGAAFMENYAYSTLGLTGGTTLSFGLLLLGPGITYPLTGYPSEGVFLVIGGNPEWKCGNQPWKTVKPGSIVYRPPNGAEAKRPGQEPMLALYAWLPLNDQGLAGRRQS